ncbi:MAG: outer membrane beta-barrel protein [Steroidobacteraceae bacterium]
MTKQAALFAALALFAGSAIADDTGFYAGAGVGWGQVSLPKSKITNSFAAAFAANGAPIDTWSAKTDDSSIPWSATVGYRILKYLAVEAGYLDTGSASYTGSGTVDDIDLGPLPAKGKLDWGATGWQASVLGIWPIDDTWSVFGRVGGFFGDVKATARITVDTASGKGHDSANSNEFLYGVGVDSKFLEQWTARLEWLAMPSLGNNDTGSADWNGIQFSLLYQF